MEGARSCACVVLGALLWAGPVRAGEPSIEVVHQDGAWCWFQDERALVVGDHLVVASVARSGRLDVTQLDLATGARVITPLREGFEPDDHNAPALVRRPDGHFVAFYTRHHRDALMRMRVSERPDDATAWQPEQTFDAGVKQKFTYANPFIFPAQPGRLHLFWRGLRFHPTWSFSDDGGATWSPGRLFLWYGRGTRPYVKYASDGRDAVHLFFTETHPRQEPTSLYHAILRNGILHRSDGRPIRAWGGHPPGVWRTTRIFRGGSAEGVAWVWDGAIDARGWPVVVYTAHRGPGDIRYRYARWDGTAWRDQEVARAGSALSGDEAQYAGGICLDPDRPDTVYLSSNADLVTGRPAGRYEIHRGVTPDGGATWRWTALTAGSSVDNLRPLVPARHPAGEFVLWFRGTYTAYTNFATEVVLARARSTAP